MQIIELPKIVPAVREHRFHVQQCEQCGQWSRAWNEEIINGSRYGERLAAM